MRGKFLGVIPAPGDDYDILPGPANQLGDQLHPLEHGRFLTGGEQAVEVQLDQFVETAKRVDGDVERAVKGDLQRARQLDQLPGSLGIDRAVGVEHADHHAVDAGLLQRDDVVFHHRKLVVRVEDRRLAAG